VSSGKSEHSRDSSLERKSVSPSARGGSSKAVDSDSEKHSTSRHSSRKKKKRKHHHHHHHHRHRSKSPESLEHKRGKKEKKKHKSKKKHKRHHDHDEPGPSKEQLQGGEESLPHQMEEGKQTRDSIGRELEGGDNYEEGKSHDTVMESSTGTETIAVEPEFNTREFEDVPANDALVKNEQTVEQHDDHVTPPPPPVVLVGVASPRPANQSPTEE
jgi:hypothetical protein